MNKGGSIPIFTRAAHLQAPGNGLLCTAAASSFRSEPARALPASCLALFLPAPPTGRAWLRSGAAVLSCQRSCLSLPHRISSRGWHRCSGERPRQPLPQNAMVPSIASLFPFPFPVTGRIALARSGSAVLHTLVREGMCLSLFLEIICLSTL